MQDGAERKCPEAGQLPRSPAKDKGEKIARRRKTLESPLKLMEDQRFQALETIENYHRLVPIVSGQLVTGQCLELLNDLGDRIQPWAPCGTTSAALRRNGRSTWTRERRALARLVSAPLGVPGRGRSQRGERMAHSLLLDLIAERRRNIWQGISE